MTNKFAKLDRVVSFTRWTAIVGTVFVALLWFVLLILSVL
jgi:hypothetical protein